MAAAAHEQSLLLGDSQTNNTNTNNNTPNYSGGNNASINIGLVGGGGGGGGPFAALRQTTSSHRTSVSTIAPGSLTGEEENGQGGGGGRDGGRAVIVPTFTSSYLMTAGVTLIADKVSLKRRTGILCRQRDVKVDLINGSAVLRPGKLHCIASPREGTGAEVLRALSGTRPCASGIVTADGIPVTASSFRYAVGSVESRLPPYPYLSNRKNIAIQLRRRRRCQSGTEVGERIEDVMQFLGIDGDQKSRKNTPFEHLMLQIARELVSDPPVLFVRSPVSEIDYHQHVMVAKALKHIAKTLKKTVVISTAVLPMSLFERLDTIMLVGEGGHVFCSGDVPSVVDFFSSLKLTCAAFMSPLDEEQHYHYQHQQQQLNAQNGSRPTSPPPAPQSEGALLNINGDGAAEGLSSSSSSSPSPPTRVTAAALAALKKQQHQQQQQQGYQYQQPSHVHGGGVGGSGRPFVVDSPASGEGLGAGAREERESAVDPRESLASIPPIRSPDGRERDSTIFSDPRASNQHRRRASGAGPQSSSLHHQAHNNSNNTTPYSADLLGPVYDYDHSDTEGDGNDRPNSAFHAKFAGSGRVVRTSSNNGGNNTVTHPHSRNSTAAADTVRRDLVLSSPDQNNNSIPPNAPRQHQQQQQQQQQHYLHSKVISIATANFRDEQRQSRYAGVLADMPLAVDDGETMLDIARVWSEEQDESEHFAKLFSESSQHRRVVTDVKRSLTVLMGSTGAINRPVGAGATPQGSISPWSMITMRPNYFARVGYGIVGDTLDAVNRWENFAAAFIMFIVLLLSALFVERQDDDQGGMQNKRGIVFFLFLVLMEFNALFIPTYIEETECFIEQRNSGTANAIVQTVLVVLKLAFARVFILSVVAGFIFYSGQGLGWTFVLFWGVTSFMHSLITYAFSVTFMHARIALMLSFAFTLYSVLFSGFLINLTTVHQIPGYISAIRWGYGAVIHEYLVGKPFNCDANNAARSNATSYCYTGDQYLELEGLANDSTDESLDVLVITSSVVILYLLSRFHFMRGGATC